MSIINNGLLLAAGADAATTYQISRSIRLNSADSAHFSRTPGSAGSRTTWTWSAWIKRSKLGAAQEIWGAYTGTGNDEGLFYATFESDDKLYIYGWSSTFRKTTQVFRDVSAWYHIVIAADVTNGTANNRLRIYVNGSEVTTFDTITNPASTSQFAINSASAHYIGADPYSPSNRKGDYMLADVYLLDGTATTPSTFAETDAITGQWVPKTPTGISYGTNGFRLSFSDNSGTTSTTLGKDAAGSNNWTPNNFSVASGSGNDSLVDSPTGYGTDTGAGGEVRGNYATLNPLQNGAGTLTNGNLDMTGPASAYGTRVSTIGVSTGKWYFEATPTNGAADAVFGITPSLSPSANIGNTSDSYGASYGYLGTGSKLSNNSSSSYGAAISNNDVVGVAFDADAGTLTFYKNGSSQGTAYSSIPSKTYFLGVSLYGTTGAGNVNFGQRQWAYAPPAGFKALCTTNLPTPTIALPNTVMDVKLYTGNGSSITVSGLNFSPDFIWGKNRSATAGHEVYDTVRGVKNGLLPDSTIAELTNDATLLTAFNSDGFTYSSNIGMNGNGNAHVAWCFDAGSSTVTNNSGSISSQVRANASAGFSVVTFTSPTGTGNFSAGHGLGVIPEFVIVKSRNAVGVWYVYHKSLATDYYLRLNGTNAAATDGVQWGAGMTSTVLGLRASYSTVSGATTVAYAFAPVAGFSAFGSYTGNGSSTDGPFVYCGFRPRWLMIKNTTKSTQSWLIRDAARDTYNSATSAKLAANLSDQENGTNVGTASQTIADFLSNGFKVRTAGGPDNDSGDVYVWAAFAESPFAYARAR